MQLLRLFSSMLFMFACLGIANATNRVALVIGNSNYDHVSSLSNPQNDAREISASLERLGFAVTKASDLSFDAMRKSLRLFSKKATGAEVALVFFAGHGIEVNKQNYLIPTDARLETDQDISYEAVPLDLVMDAVSGAIGLRLILLDACRDNPFAASMKMTSATRSIGRGLARVEPDVGTLVSFAAREGTTADDGDGQNSPYTTALLKHIEEPGLEINFLFRKVRDSVMENTGRRQQPFTYGSLPGNEIFLAGEQVAVGSKANSPTTNTVDKLTLAVGNLRQGMKYAEARRVLINGGWQASMFRWQEISERCGFREDICHEYQETVSCSGTGSAFCRFEYTDANGARLTLITTGEELEFLELSNWSLQ